MNFNETDEFYEKIDDNFYINSFGLYWKTERNGVHIDKLIFSYAQLAAIRVLIKKYIQKAGDQN